MKTKVLKNKNIEPTVYDFVGKPWVEYMVKNAKGRDLIIGVGEEEALITSPPYSWYEEQKDRSLFGEFIAEKAKEGWSFSASWGYYFFRRPRKDSGAVNIDLKNSSTLTK